MNQHIVDQHIVNYIRLFATFTVCTAHAKGAAMVCVVKLDVECESEYIMLRFVSLNYPKKHAYHPNNYSTSTDNQIHSFRCAAIFETRCGGARTRCAHPLGSVRY